MDSTLRNNVLKLVKKVFPDARYDYSFGDEVVAINHAGIDRYIMMSIYNHAPADIEPHRLAKDIINRYIADILGDE